VIPQTLRAYAAFHPLAASYIASSTVPNSEKVFEVKVPEELLTAN
jgi:hypothetical protein